MNNNKIITAWDLWIKLYSKTTHFKLMGNNRGVKHED